MRTGSLHNRVTARICLMPFALNECERYVRERGLEMSCGDLAECYMIFGGIPYYWRGLRQGLSLAQNVGGLIARIMIVGHNVRTHSSRHRQCIIMQTCKSIVLSDSFFCKMT